MFENREQAGKKLAKELKKYAGKNIIVLAIPRGGVIVAKEIAKELNSKLDLIVPRKIGAPWERELAIGAVAQDGSLVLNEDLIKELGIPKEYIQKEKEKELKEIERRLKVYRGNKKFPELKNKIVVLVDDGIATGATIKAALKFIKNQKPKKIVIAVPVAPLDTLKELEKEVDEIICLEKPKFMGAISEFYLDFKQVEDEEVVEIMKEFLKSGNYF
jgi:putative phosphoribosyl transferase